MRILYRGLAACWGLIVGTCTAPSCFASTLNAVVIDPNGKPVSNVVVVARPVSAISLPAQARETAVMDQINQEFVPRVLAIRTGTRVLFPNSDAVAHQVYSFSPAKRFALPLYRGHAQPPVLFDQPGIVTLGCNIHDQMIGYIFVTDAPYFAITDVRGEAALKDVAAGDYRLSIWSPRINEPRNEQHVAVKDESTSVTFRLLTAPRADIKKNNDRIRDY